MAETGQQPAGFAATLVSLARIVPGDQRRRLAAVLALMFAGAIAELAAIGAVFPFLAVLADPERLQSMPLANRLLEIAGAETIWEIVATFAALFAAAALLAGVVRILLVRASQNLVFDLAHWLGVEVHRRIIAQPYGWHIAHNSADIIAGIDKVQVLLFNLLIPAMQAASALLIALFIVTILVWIDPLAALVAAGAFSLLYVIISVAARGRLRAGSAAISAALGRRVQAIQESLGGIRDIIIDRSQSHFVAEFEQIDAGFRRAQAFNAFVAAAPRFAIEAAGMVLIAGLALVLAAREGGLVAAVPVLGALALGAQRLLPLMQQVYYGWSALAGGWAVLADVERLLALPMPARRAATAPIPFRKAISLHQLSFAYPGRSEPVLTGIDLEIARGARIALVGRTGSGKSTLADLVMGLLAPTDGEIRIDGKPLTGRARLAWLGRIAHVPQSIFLADATITRNIAFGSADAAIDEKRVERAARLAQLHDFIANLPEGYRTQIGERGIRLSGGQRQRLGLARALYRRPSVLILDEATSALDEETEAAVLAALRSLDPDMTILMIAHRASTVGGCDRIVRLERGRIAAIEERKVSRPKRRRPRTAR